MNKYIINLPQLQSFSQRLGAIAVWLICWLMWIYLLLPFLTLCGWLLGDHNLTDEMRWFGGYKSLLQLLQIYLITLLVLIGICLAWVIYHFIRQPVLIPAANKVVSDAEIMNFYQVKLQEVRVCRKAQLVTVYFDEQGQVTLLTPEIK